PMKIPLSAVTSVVVRGDDLRVTWPGGTAALTLGRAAEKWALKMKTPRGLMDKLGVKPDSRVSALAVADEAILKDLRERTPNVTEGKAAKGSDLLLILMQARRELSRLSSLRAALKENGAIWVFWAKGRKELREDDVRAAALSAGLVDVKVASISEALSGLKLVIPVAQRVGKT
ncbi:MAG: hypothetical protein ACHQNV_04995, partial [Vicinamibacteria bacterium]